MSQENEENRVVQVYQPDFSISAADLLKRHKDVEWLLAKVMVKGMHYGVIPGSKKNSLLKPGSELLLPRFGLGCFPVVQDLSNEYEIKFMVEAKGVHIATGVHVGSGIGICSSNEEKYKWRRAASKREFENAPPEARRVKYGKDYTIDQVRQSPDDLMNTILKMAKKRAQIDLTLTCTAASSFFTQDIEDFESGLRDAEEGTIIDAEVEPAMDMPTEAPYGIKDHGGAKWLVVTPSKIFPEAYLIGIGFVKGKAGSFAAKFTPEAEAKLKTRIAENPPQ